MQQRKKQAGPQDMKKMMRKMKKQGQMDFDEVQNVEVVIIRTADKEIVIPEAQVTKLMIPGQGEMYQIIGESTEHSKGAGGPEIKEEETPIEMEVSPEDAQLVAGQAGVSIEEATAALKQTEGDLAKAILLLKHI